MVNLPYGTILTVPRLYDCPAGWVDYIQYTNTPSLYPELYKVIGTNYLDTVHPVYAGSIKLSLGGEEVGSWVEWSKIGHLSQYPELQCAVIEMVSNISEPETQKYWESCIEKGYLPNVSNLFFAINSTGGKFSSGASGGVLTYPMVQHTDNLVRPLGLSAIEEPKEVYTSVEGKDVVETNIPANFVLLGQDASLLRLKEQPHMVQVGSGSVGYPAHLTVQVLVNTVTYIPSVPNTHKLIIKVE